MSVWPDRLRDQAKRSKDRWGLYEQSGDYIEELERIIGKALPIVQDHVERSRLSDPNCSEVRLLDTMKKVL